mmetsp:Transcript_17065/g.26347  ORF Transcript_17065/g.26347 Transcript_17065/m.26347 type:complete len:242 (-) Transcript_17065:329-1054(-)
MHAHEREEGRNGRVRVLICEGLLVGVARPWEISLVELQLRLEQAESLLGRGRLHELLDDGDDLLGVLLDLEDVGVSRHDLLVLGLLALEIILHFVQLANLTDSIEELVTAAAELVLKEREPEDDRMLAGLERLHDQEVVVVVEHVLEVNLVNLVLPGVQHREALVVHVLSAEPLDVSADELEVGLVRLYGVAQQVLLRLLLVIPKVRPKHPHARLALEVLGIVELIEHLFNGIEDNSGPKV